MGNDAARARNLFDKAKAALEQHHSLTALRLAEEAAAMEPVLADVHAFRAQCLAGLGRFADALAAVEVELAREPSSPQALALRRAIQNEIAKQNEIARQPRRWETTLIQQVMGPIEAATHRYTYRGHAMIKNPFDLALYPLLLWNLKPRTIFEVGSYNGASALWMADTLSTYGVESQIHSVDVIKVSNIAHERITFYEGSGRELSKIWPAQMLAELPRPFLVIEDADHTLETTRAVLEHFHPHMRAREYIVVEDGLSAQGPRDALAHFLPTHANQWQVDSFYCDFFGYNATWCVNGFLKRVAD